jgi:hypothetical protein
MTEQQRERRRRRIARIAEEQRHAKQLDLPPPRDLEAEVEIENHKRRVIDGIGGAWVARQRGLVGSPWGDLPRSRQ